MAFLAVAAVAMFAACWLAFAGSARADQSCSRSCGSATERVSHAVALQAGASTGGAATSTPSYLAVAAIGLGALGLVLLIGGALLLAAGRRQQPAAA